MIGPHTLTKAENAKLRETGESMLQTLENHATANHFLWTGDERWLFYEHQHEIMWTAAWEEVGELARPRHCYRKTMAIAFFNCTEEYFLNVLPRSRSMGICYFAGEVIGGLEDICSPEDRNSHQSKRFFILTVRPYTTQERS
jgi:hypothetical protein